MKTSNKGRITRIDQAWDAAYREKAIFERIADKDEAFHQACVEDVLFTLARDSAQNHAAECELSRITDGKLAMRFALMEQRARQEYGESWRDRLAYEVECEETRVLDPGEAEELAIDEYDFRQEQSEHDETGDTESVGQIVPIEAVEPPPVLSPMLTLVLPLKLITPALIVAAKDDIRYYLCGVYIHAVDGEIRICSTDGHRLLVSRFEIGKEQTLPAWAEDGIIIPRNDLAQMLPLLSKNSASGSKWDHSEPSLIIDYGKGNPEMLIRSTNGFAQFKLKPLEGKFPDYARILASSGATLARGDNEAMTASAINAKYLKSVGEVADKLGARAVHSFINGSDASAAFFTFSGAPDTVLIVMPTREGDAVSDSVVKLIGSQAISLSITAMKAHITRTTKLLASAKGHDAQELEAKRIGYQDRIAHLMALTGDGPKRLSAPAAA